MDNSEIKKELDKIYKRVTTYGGHFDIEAKTLELLKLEDSMSAPNFWDNRENAEKTIKEVNALKNLTTDISKFKTELSDSMEIADLIVEADKDMKQQLEYDLATYKTKIAELEIYLLLNEPYDKNNCIIEVHAGAGGTEACDWALMIFRMYMRYCEKNGYSTSVLDYQESDEAGIKSASVLVKGPYAYGHLKCEKGVHRLVRLSPFDANNKRHTSFASLEVTPEFDNNLDIEINEQDLKIDVYRSGGAGGQHVNTTDSAVRITHLPSKIVVTCQNERSQIQNREMAMKMLKGKLKLLEIEKNQQELSAFKGEQKNIEFGSQIRNYVLHPYSLIKDTRTGIETSNIDKVLDGDINMFIEGYLRGGN
ncbi:MAG: peptide chain release factor 2 [Bacilli bacterium]